VGGLGIALVPVLGFMSGGVNPDAMVFAVTAAGFFCLARAFRYGLTATRAAAIGAVVAVGSLTKLNFIGLAPGLVLGLIVLAVRAARTSGRAAWRWLALGLAIAVTPACVYLLVNLARGHSVLGSVSQVLHPTGRGSLLGEISYIWQFYLPRLPGMATDFPGIFPTRQIWFDRSVGFYGWLDTEFPVWAENVALIPAVALTILGIRALVTVRATLRRRLVELGVYALMSLGVLLLIGTDSYIKFPGQAGTYAEPRYLLPMVPLVGAALALSARGAGRRWGPVAGVAIVVLFLGWNIVSQLQVISRFYG
jgi:4-amino-4-deoxy-L-arabinose transferase-like glycosyltransferase